MAELRFAVLGTGFFSTFQIPAWFEVGGVKLVALYNRTVSKAEKLAEEYNVPCVYGDAEELFKNENVDFVDIITEAPAHGPLVLLAAKYKVPVICQKPMAHDFNTCLKMVKACKESEIPFFIHDNYRWFPPMLKVKKALKEGQIGNPFRANVQLGTGGVKGLETQPYLKTLKHYALFDMGSHLFDLARFFFGEPQNIYCQTYTTTDQIVGEDVVSSVLRFGDVIFHGEITERCNTQVYIEGTKGAIELDCKNILNIITEKNTIRIDCNRLSKKYPFLDNYIDEVMSDIRMQAIVDCNRHFLRALKKNRNADTSGEDNIKTMKIMFSAIESAEQDKLIRL